MVDYSDRLRQAMASAGMTTPKLAKALGISYQAVKKVLDRKTNSLTAENNALAAAKLGVSPNWLATGKELVTTNLDETPGLAPTAPAAMKDTAPPSPGAQIYAAALAIRSLSPEKRDSVAQLASMMLRSGPSESMAKVIDEIAHVPPVAGPSVSKTERWHEDLRSVIAQAPDGAIAQRMRELAEGLGLGGGPQAGEAGPSQDAQSVSATRPQQ